MRRRLIDLGVIPETDHGKGGRKRYYLDQLQPLFKRAGMPKDLKLTLPLGL